MTYDHHRHQLHTGRAFLCCVSIWIGCFQLQGVSSFGILPCTSYVYSAGPVAHYRANHCLSNILQASEDEENIGGILKHADQQDSATNDIILCDLQTLLRLAGCLETGGSAKVAIQSGKCQLNGQVETRRAKKLFSGDVVEIQGQRYHVEEIVHDKQYSYKSKVKKIKPQAKMLEDGTMEFGGRHRSQEWREQRRQRKIDRKSAKERK